VNYARSAANWAKGCPPACRHSWRDSHPRTSCSTRSTRAGSVAPTICRGSGTSSNDWRRRYQSSNRILGFTVVGADASELIATVQTAMLGDLPFTDLRDALFTHPTTAEGLTLLLSNVTSVQ
jgi:hypothetical protein